MTLVKMHKCSCGQPATILRAGRWGCAECTPVSIPYYPNKPLDPSAERIRHLERLAVACAKHDIFADRDIEAEGRAIMERDRA